MRKNNNIKSKPFQEGITNELLLTKKSKFILLFLFDKEGIIYWLSIVESLSSSCISGKNLLFEQSVLSAIELI